MTYKIDEKLPWFKAKDILQEDMYVNIISEKHSEELNPNGLFSGFLSGDIFFTSRWNGFHFEPLNIKQEDISDVLFLEIIESKKPKDFRKDASENISVTEYFKKKQEEKKKEEAKSLEDIIKDNMDRARRIQARNTFYPNGRIPYQNAEDARKDWEDISRIISKGSKTLFNNKDFNTVFKNWEDFFNTPNKDIK